MSDALTSPTHITIPEHLYGSQYWRPVIYLFTQHTKLRQYIHYVDFKGERIDVTKLKRAARVWSQSEKFILSLALHCFNERNKINLGDMDYLDSYHKRMVFEALHLRYGGRG
ncbi:hypothetical protein [Aneurinibacillus danicus]|jgi:hypothetical protein|uniref:Uncharacterized protein n=1 Tax=Aneurinibacillus danicus TaxID=267746 RepID=A0A511VCL3_9BACL|nr:hypothetical protein [Aneurinibacillus danicus]GEN36589.1 hypothetical protein ADA01nite_40490 [Aneurinibacillus danicus]